MKICLKHRQVRSEYLPGVRGSVSDQFSDFSDLVHRSQVIVIKNIINESSKNYILKINLISGAQDKVETSISSPSLRDTKTYSPSDPEFRRTSNLPHDPSPELNSDLRKNVNLIKHRRRPNDASLITNAVLRNVPEDSKLETTPGVGLRTYTKETAVISTHARSTTSKTTTIIETEKNEEIKLVESESRNETNRAGTELRNKITQSGTKFRSKSKLIETEPRKVPEFTVLAENSDSFLTDDLDLTDDLSSSSHYIPDGLIASDGDCSYALEGLIRHDEERTKKRRKTARERQKYFTFVFSPEDNLQEVRQIFRLN